MIEAVAVRRNEEKLGLFSFRGVVGPVSNDKLLWSARVVWISEPLAVGERGSSRASGLNWNLDDRLKRTGSKDEGKPGIIGSRQLDLWRREDNVRVVAQRKAGRRRAASRGVSAKSKAAVCGLGTANWAKRPDQCTCNRPHVS